ncbi:MAG: hypothetical protein O3A95_03515 [Planctomycetota bacterium]|nr:hypothetical protein [Planctomycetota bacterium]MDA1113350.1 hypothetical protein [Planctomycetota bacterium]
MIEPSPHKSSESQRSTSAKPLSEDAIVLEDLAAAIRIPSLFRRVRHVLARAFSIYHLPDDSPFQLTSANPGNGEVDFGFRWMDPQGLLQIFLGMCWGEEGHDPIWEVRVEATSVDLAAHLRTQHWHRLAARRADSRFSEWDRFWQEEEPTTTLLFGASAAVTRFFEEEYPERKAADYLAGALYALYASGAVTAILEVAKEAVGGGHSGNTASGHG